MDPRHILFLVLINILGGASPILLKLGFAQMPPLLLTSLRFLLLSALFIPFTRWHGRQMATLLVAAALAGAVQFATFMTAIDWAGQVSPIVIATQLNAPFATLLSVLFLNEHVHWRRWTGLALAFLGCAVIAFDPRVFAFIGAFLLAAGAALSAAVAAVLMRRLKGISTFEFLAWVAHVSWPTLLVLSALTEEGQIGAVIHARAMPWLAIFYTALVSSVLFHGGFYFLVQRYEISKVAPFLLIAPPATVLFGVVFLHDVLTARIIAGSLVTLVGVGIILIRDRHNPRERIMT